VSGGGGGDNDDDDDIQDLVLEGVEHYKGP
jgi:hypothetical protein